MATAHLLFGYLGSGKTTFAKHLEVEHGAVRFTPDEWMARLFGDDPPEESFPEKAEAILELLEPLWTRCLSLGLDVVLDYGFWRRKERDEVRAVVERLGASACLYRLECPDEEARMRIEARNQADDRSLYIAPATYDALWRRFEPLDVDEACLEADDRTVRRASKADLPADVRDGWKAATNAIAASDGMTATTACGRGANPRLRFR